jgi:hypothetical protein
MTRLFEQVEAPRDRGLRWRLVRAAVSLGAFACAFVDGLGFFLSPGQAVVWAVGSATTQAPDSRWGIFLGLVFYAGLAFLSVVMRARHEAALAERAPDAATSLAHLDVAA